MSDLTVEKIIEIHDEVIARYGGARGVLSEATLHYMVFRANRMKDTFTRAATILHAIGSQHPFMNGNKRTALIVAENVLGQMGFFYCS
jgi:death-on-curing protein